MRGIAQPLAKSHPWIHQCLQQIHQQVDQYVDDRDDQCDGDNDRKINIQHRFGDIFPDSRPGKYRLHQEGAGNRIGE